MHTSGRTIALYPGAFRPVHAAHLAGLDHLLADPSIDEVVVVITTRNRLIPGTSRVLTAGTARSIWQLLTRDNRKVRIELARGTAVAHAIDYCRADLPHTRLLFCIGEQDHAAGDGRYRKLHALTEFSDTRVEIRVLPTGYIPVRSTQLRASLADPENGRQRFIEAMPGYFESPPVC